MRVRAEDNLGGVKAQKGLPPRSSVPLPAYLAQGENE